MHISGEPIHFTCPVNTIAVLKRYRKSNYVRGCGFALICRFRRCCKLSVKTCIRSWKCRLSCKCNFSPLQWAHGAPSINLPRSIESTIHNSSWDRPPVRNNHRPRPQETFSKQMRLFSRRLLPRLHRCDLFP